MSDVKQQLAWQQSIWHPSIWRELTALAKHNQLHHAFIFTGPRGIGKYQLASAYASYLLCDAQSSVQQACGVCKSCRLIQANNHPDLYDIQPEEKSKIIKIDQVRQLITELGKTASLSGRRIVIINPAEAMNEAAANALLKNLEEPGANTHFFLIAESVDLLPPTIRSRCQVLRLAAPNQQQATSWLQDQLVAQEISLSTNDLNELLRLAGGAPLLVVELIQQYTLPILLAQIKMLSEDLLALQQRTLHPLVCAARWQKSPVPFPLLLVWWIYGLQGQLVEAVGRNELRPYKTEKQMAFLDHLLEVRGQLQKHTTLNEALLLEDLLIRWYDLSQTTNG